MDVEAFEPRIWVGVHAIVKVKYRNCASHNFKNGSCLRLLPH
jgi:hypothetical protein